MEEDDSVWKIDKNSNKVKIKISLKPKWGNSYEGIYVIYCSLYLKTQQQFQMEWGTKQYSSTFINSFSYVQARRYGKTIHLQS